MKVNFFRFLILSYKIVISCLKSKYFLVVKCYLRESQSYQFNADNASMRQFIVGILFIALLVGCSAKMDIIKAKLVSYEITHAPVILETYLQKAYQYYDEKKFDSTLVYCHKSYAENSENWELFYLYGKTALQLHQFDQADFELSKALALCKSQSDSRAQIYFALGENEDARGNFALAKQHYIMVIQLTPNSELAESASKKIHLISVVQ